MRFKPTDKVMSFKRVSTGETATFGMRCSFQAIGMMEEANGDTPFMEIFGKGSIGISTLAKCLHASICAYNAHHSKQEPDQAYVYGMLDDGLDFLEATKNLSSLISESSATGDDKPAISQSEIDARFGADADPLGEPEAETNTEAAGSTQP